MAFKKHGFTVIGGISGGGDDGQPPKEPEAKHLSDEKVTQFFNDIKATNPLNIVVITETDNSMIIDSFPNSKLTELGAVTWAYRSQIDETLEKIDP
jgi:hypothetical protein